MEKLIKLIETLRGAAGCPWDRKQSPQSISVYLVEEVHELVDAIVRDDPQAICEELGDVLFHIAFIACLFNERAQFNIDDVQRVNIEKMVRRHPHVFGDASVETTEEVRQQWRKIKQQEKSVQPDASILDAIPSSLPALMRAYRVSERAAGQGFDWHDIDGVIAKAEEEWHELKAELAGLRQGRADDRRVALEFGDVLFTLVNVARFAGIHPEMALAEATRKFILRFRYMEQAIAESGRRFEAVSHEELQVLWAAAKTKFEP
jgi:tetrapyrrole methylase family protein/MazG family protein